jgi:hypothetical protein
LNEHSFRFRWDSETVVTWPNRVSSIWSHDNGCRLYSRCRFGYYVGGYMAYCRTIAIENLMPSYGKSLEAPVLPRKIEKNAGEKFILKSALFCPPHPLKPADFAKNREHDAQNFKSCRVAGLSPAVAQVGPVAQVFNLTYRRFQTCAASKFPLPTNYFCPADFEARARAPFKTCAT